MTIYIYQIKGKRRAIIEHEKNIGFYLHMYDMDTGKCTHDYLEDSLLNAKLKAKEKFSVDVRFWHEIPYNE